jgi:hypothetical protein
MLDATWQNAASQRDEEKYVDSAKPRRPINIEEIEAVIPASLAGTVDIEITHSDGVGDSLWD